MGCGARPVEARRIVQMRDGKIISDRSVSADERERALAARSARPEIADHEPPTGEALPEGEPLVAAGPLRMARGVTGALVCAIIAPLVAVAATVGVFGLATMGPQQKTGLSQAFIALGLSVLAGFGLSVILGIVAIVLSRGASKRMKTEPGNWIGAGRAKIALILGSVAVASPLLGAVAARLFGPSGAVVGG